MMRDADDDEGGPGRGAEAVPEHRGLLCRRPHASGQRVFSRCPVLSTNPGILAVAVIDKW